ncbi:hypothetical protein CWC38_00480 [Kocuria tytonicola]|uniref:hypothetical protein n=1 Tax=Kocuria tytonicola TaxID=2055946 RepID=UPI000EF8743F|nr:hypothetical protein [Kocuria tytonicola]RLZ04401.1 hypothetical protein CWC38_00480 [Kocuria tytonicola]
MKRAYTYPTGIALAAAVALGSLPAAHAQPAPAEQASAAAVSQALSADAASGNASVTSVEGLDEKLIAKYDPYVTVDAQGAYTLNLPAGQDFPASEVELVKKAISQANADQKQAMDSGAATRDGDGHVGAQASHGGFKAHWWGVELWLDNYAVGQAQKILTAGAGVSALAAAIMSWTGLGGGVAGVVAGAFAAAGGIAGLCNWNDKGISIKKPHVGPVVCWPR